MGLADAVANSKAKPDRKGTWMTPGKYPLLQVTAVKEAKNGDLFIGEMDVLESSGEEAALPGDETSICIDCVKFDGGLAGQAKLFLAAASGYAVEEVVKLVVESALDPSQPFVGALVRAEAWSYTTKNDKTITKQSFSPALPGDAERVGALRAELGLQPLPVKVF